MTYKNYVFGASKKLPVLAGILCLMLAGNAFGLEKTGNMGVYSKYVLRGIAEENSGAAVQGGYDLNWDSGFYLGWWASSLSYTYKDSGIDYTSTGFENNIYGGYTGSVDWFGYTAGLIQYLYLSVDDSNLTELLLNADFKYVDLQAQILLNDGWWGNSGDVYWTLNGDYDIPSNFNVGFSLGYYTYNKSDNDKLSLKADGLETTKSSAFRHLNISLTHPIGNTGADMGLTYIIAGEDRTGAKYDDTMVLNISFGFDL